MVVVGRDFLALIRDMSVCLGAAVVAAGVVSGAARAGLRANRGILCVGYLICSKREGGYVWMYGYGCMDVYRYADVYASYPLTQRW